MSDKKIDKDKVLLILSMQLLSLEEKKFILSYAVIFSFLSIYLMEKLISSLSIYLM